MEVEKQWRTLVTFLWEIYLTFISWSDIGYYAPWKCIQWIAILSIYGVWKTVTWLHGTCRHKTLKSGMAIDDHQDCFLFYFYWGVSSYSTFVSFLPKNLKNQESLLADREDTRNLRSSVYHEQKLRTILSCWNIKLKHCSQTRSSIITNSLGNNPITNGITLAKIFRNSKTKYLLTYSNILV